MKLINCAELSREQLLAVVAVIVVVAAGQSFMMKKLERQTAEITSVRREAAAGEAALEARSNALFQYKAAARIDKDELPSPVESQNRLYSALIGAFSARGLEGADIEKTAEADGIVSFRVSGNLPYASLLDVLSSFRQGPYLIKITDFSLGVGKNENVRFGFTVEAEVERGRKEEGNKQDEGR